MPLELEYATDTDAAAIAALRLAAARDLTARHGHGTWSFAAESAAGVRADLRASTVLIARTDGLVSATLRLSDRSPWIGNLDFFTTRRHPLFLTSMAVSPALQRRGIGRACIEQVKSLAARWPADAIRLDAYDSAAGAGGFYLKCGFREVRRAPYNGTPLIFFEYVLRNPD